MKLDYNEGFKDGLRQALVLVLNHSDAPVTAIKVALDMTYEAMEKPFPPVAADADTDNTIQTKSAPALSGDGGN